MQLRKLALALTALFGCHGGESGQTCFSINLTYRGTRNGPAYAKLVAVDNPPALTQADKTDSIQELLVVYNTLQVCYGAHGRPPLAVNVDAWIDVTGNDAHACGHILDTQCQPSASDPQGHQSATIYSEQVNVIRLEIIDPP